MRRIAAAVLFLQAAAAATLAAQGSYGVTVFGTERVTEGEIRSSHARELDELLRLQGEDEEAFRRAARDLESALNRDGRFSYVHVELFRSYTDELDFIIDFVEPQDAAARLAFRQLETRRLEDPGDLLARWREYEAASRALFEAGEISDMSCPVVHCTWGFNHPELRPFLTYFALHAPRHAAALEEVLLHGDAPELREAAAFVLPHAGHPPPTLVRILEPSVEDPASSVRNAGLRVLYYAVKADPTLPIPLDKVIVALGYPSFTDRNKALVILRSLPGSEFTPPRLRATLPILLEILRKQDAHNYRNAHAVLRNLSGLAYAADETEAWAEWVRTATP